MNDILKTIQTALEEKGVTAAAASRTAVGNASLIKNMMNSRGDNPRYSMQALQELAAVLDLELYFGPKRPRETLNGFSESAMARIDPSVDGNPEALRQGFLPIPFHVDDLSHKGVAPIALARAWLVDQGMKADDLSFISMPGDDMAPSISPGELLLVDAAEKLAVEPALSAFVLDGRLGVGWAMRPASDTVAVFFQRRYATPVALPQMEIIRYRHLGGITARFDDLPSPWISTPDKIDMLEKAREMLLNRK